MQQASKAVRWAVASAMLAATAGAGAEPLPDEVDALTWDVRALEAAGQDGARAMEFPENSAGAPAPEAWKAKPSIGVVFSGGGIRSAAATLGQLRALKELDWYRKVKYVSSVSGGTWGSLPFTYLPRAYRDEDYLGPYRPPHTLTDEDFMPNGKQAFARVIAGAKVYGKALFGWATFTGDETFAHVLGELFLEPYGLNEKQSFAWTPRHIGEIVLRNASCAPATAWNEQRAARRVPCPAGMRPSSFLPPEEFIAPQADRPFHIVGSTLIAQRGWLQTGLPKEWIFPLEITPYYTGTREAGAHVFAGTGVRHTIGGIYVESFAYDSKRPRPVGRVDEAVATPQIYRSSINGLYGRFHLRDVLAASGAAPQEVTSAIGFRNLGFPEFRHWSMDETGVLPTTREMAHGDGGHIDNIGLIPLLARGVENILVFVNSETPFRNVLGPDDAVGNHAMYGDLIAFFGKGRNHVIASAKACEGKTGCTPLRDLYDAYARKKLAGQPLVHCDAYGILARAGNPRMPHTSKPTNICWVYLDAPAQWDAEVARSALDKWKADLQLKQNHMKDFPNFKTFFPATLEVINYRPEQVSALAHLTAWTVCRAAPEIAPLFKLSAAEMRHQCGAQ